MIRSTLPTTFPASNPWSEAAGGMALSAEMKSAIRTFNNPLTIEGWVVSWNLSTLDIRRATINGNLYPGGLTANLRLRDQSGIPDRVTLNGNIQIAGTLSIRTNSEAALINGNVDCNGGGANSNIKFKDPEDGYTRCPFIPSDLSLSVTESADPVPVGQTVTYTADVTNNTLSPAVEAVNVVVTFAISGAPAEITGLTFQSQPGGPCTFNATSASCTLTGLREFENGQFPIAVTVRRDGPSTIVTDVSVSARNSDPNPSDNAVTETTN